MTEHLITERERELLLEVLEAERRRLLPEIRHTDTRQMRTDLQLRLRTIEQMAARLEEARADIPRAGTR